MTTLDPRPSLRAGAPNRGYTDGSADLPTGRDGRTEPAGENSRGAKLTEAQVLDILSRPSVGPDRQSNVALAAEFGIGHRQVSAIRCGRAWGYLRREVRDV